MPQTMSRSDRHVWMSRSDRHAWTYRKKTNPQRLKICTRPASEAADHESTVQNRAAELKALAAAKKAIQQMTTGAASVTYDSSSSFLQIENIDSVNSNIRTGVDLANFEALSRLKKRKHSMRPQRHPTPPPSDAAPRSVAAVTIAREGERQDGPPKKNPKPGRW